MLDKDYRSTDMVGRSLDAGAVGAPLPKKRKTEKGAGGKPLVPVAAEFPVPVHWSEAQTTLIQDLALGTKADPRRWMQHLESLSLTLLPGQTIPPTILNNCATITVRSVIATGVTVTTESFQDMLKMLSLSGRDSFGNPSMAPEYLLHPRSILHDRGYPDAAAMQEHSSTDSTIHDSHMYIVHSAERRHRQLLAS
jgi:hypothetical protein